MTTQPESGADIKSCRAADELERYLAKKDHLQQELKELEDGTRTAELNVRRETLEREVEDLERKIKSVNEERIGRAGDKRIAESEQRVMKNV